MLSNRWFKDHVRTAENYQILYANFHVLFKNIQWKIATKFLSALVLLLALEKFVSAKPNQKYLNMVTMLFYRLLSSQSWHKGPHFYGNALNSKKRIITLLTVSHQQHPKSVFKYSLGHQNNLATTLSRVLPQRYVAEFDHVRTWYN